MLLLKSPIKQYTGEVEKDLTSMLVNPPDGYDLYKVKKDLGPPSIYNALMLGSLCIDNNCAVDPTAVPTTLIGASTKAALDLARTQGSAGPLNEDGRCPEAEPQFVRALMKAPLATRSQDRAIPIVVHQKDGVPQALTKGYGDTTTLLLTEHRGLIPGMIVRIEGQDQYVPTQLPGVYTSALNDAATVSPLRMSTFGLPEELRKGYMGRRNIRELPQSLQPYAKCLGEWSTTTIRSHLQEVLNNSKL